MASHVLTLPGLRRCGSASASDSGPSPASTASAASGLGSAASAAVLPEQNRQRSRPWSTNIKAFTSLTSFTFSFKSSFGPTCLTRSNTTRLKKNISWDVPDVPDVPGLRWHHLRDLPSWLTIQRAPCVLAALSTPGIWRTGGPEVRFESAVGHNQNFCSNLRRLLNFIEFQATAKYDFDDDELLCLHLISTQTFWSVELYNRCIYKYILYIYIYKYIYVCMSVCLPACLPVCLSVCLSVCMYVCMYVGMYACMHAYTHVMWCTVM